MDSMDPLASVTHKCLYDFLLDTSNVGWQAEISREWVSSSLCPGSDLEPIYYACRKRLLVFDNLCLVLLIVLLFSGPESRTLIELAVMPQKPVKQWGTSALTVSLTSFFHHLCSKHNAYCVTTGTPKLVSYLSRVQIRPVRAEGKFCGTLKASKEKSIYACFHFCFSSLTRRLWKPPYYQVGGCFYGCRGRSHSTRYGRSSHRRMWCEMKDCRIASVYLEVSVHIWCRRGCQEVGACCSMGSGEDLSRRCKTGDVLGAVASGCVVTSAL